MSWVRYFSKKLFAKHLPPMSPEKAAKLMAITRIVYFFSASTLLFIVVRKLKSENKDEVEAVSGRPVIQDLTPAHKRAREKGLQSAILYDYSRDKGLVKYEYHRDEYLQELEKAALEKAKEAQRKALEEGRELPPDAIRLV